MAGDDAHTGRDRETQWSTIGRAGVEPFNTHRRTAPVLTRPRGIGAPDALPIRTTIQRNSEVVHHAARHGTARRQAQADGNRPIPLQDHRRMKRGASDHPIAPLCRRRDARDLRADGDLMPDARGRIPNPDPRP
jgi:hypothetical protein